MSYAAFTIEGGLLHFPNGRFGPEARCRIPEIPDKLYFRIGEVAKLAGIKPYVLRFWESEFSGLGPKKSGTGHRLYRRKDVELVLEIKRLLYEKRFTIEGARKVLGSRPKREPASLLSRTRKPSSSPALLRFIRNCAAS